MKGVVRDISVRTSTGDRTTPANLDVPDAPSLKQFLANAKAAWCATHPHREKRRGRPYKMGVVFEIFWEAECRGLLTRTPTQGELFRLVQHRLAGQAPCERAIRRYAKMWLLLFYKPAAGRPETERLWIAEHHPMIRTLHALFLEVLLQHVRHTDRLYPDRVEVAVMIDGPHRDLLRRRLDVLGRELEGVTLLRDIGGARRPGESFLIEALRDTMPQRVNARSSQSRPRAGCFDDGVLMKPA